MRFKIALWVLGVLMARAEKNNPVFKEKLKDKNLIMEIKSGNKNARHFIFKNQQVISYAGLANNPTLSLNFKSPSIGFKAFTAKDKKQAMMNCIKEKNIIIEGSTGVMIWFQGLAKLI
jgi:hypothetical protein